MQFCDECGSMMHTEGDTWVCRSCENEEPRDSQAEAAMETREGQRDDGAPAVADATQGSTETVQEPCRRLLRGSAVHLRRVRPQVARVLTASLATPPLEYAQTATSDSQLPAVLGLEWSHTSTPDPLPQRS